MNGGRKKVLRGIIEESAEILFDFLFPPKCASCDRLVSAREKKGFCSECLSDIQWIEPPICTICGQPFGVINDEKENDPKGSAKRAVDHLCGDCLKNRYRFDMARSATVYRGKMREAIRRFKFSNMPELSRALVNVLFANDTVREAIRKLDLVIPVPLHKDRLKQRGYNQALLLAREVSKKTGIRVEDHNLRRIRSTLPQVGLGRKERTRNVKGAFRLWKPDTIKEKNLLLLDDVFTTGNTLNECALELKKKGAAKVVAVTIARVSAIHFDS